jgi:hypothetical protein
MTKEYKIMSIESYETDSSGFIHVEFRIKGDSRKTVRIIESSDYVEWVESLENNRGFGSQSWAEDYYDDYNSPIDGFDFDVWKDENEDEGYIKKYIYENYNLIDLPDPE